MDKVEYLIVKEAAHFETVGPKTLLRRLERKHIILANDPEDGRRKLVPTSALGRSAYQAWVKAQTLAALQGINGHPQKTLCVEERPDQPITSAAGSAKSLQRLLQFALPTQRETTFLDAVPPAISERYGAYIKRWAAIVGDCTNGTWQKYRGQCLARLSHQTVE